MHRHDRAPTAKPPVPLPPARRRNAPGLDAVLALQRSAGNGATARMLQRDWNEWNPMNPRSKTREGLSGAKAGGPSAAVFLAANIERAQRLSAGFPGPVCGPGDALRHCIWAALTGIDCLSYGGTLGEARAVLNNHERVWGGFENLESQMDQHNNEAGLAIADRSMPNRDEPPPYDPHGEMARPGPGEEEVQRMAMAALASGQLLILRLEDAQAELIPSDGWMALDERMWTDERRKQTGSDQPDDPPYPP
jgi:hypothetical protein